MPKEQPLTPMEQRDKIIHMVNQLVNKTLHGEYEKPSTQQLYRKLHATVTHLAKQCKAREILADMSIEALAEMRKSHASKVKLYPEPVPVSISPDVRAPDGAEG